jgi:hypothetical protein
VAVFCGYSNSIVSNHSVFFPFGLQISLKKKVICMQLSSLCTCLLFFTPTWKMFFLLFSHVSDSFNAFPETVIFPH